MKIFLALQIAAYIAATAAGVVNSPVYQEAQQGQEPPTVAETVEDAPELEVMEDG